MQHIAESSQKPDKVVVENCPDKIIVRLADNITEKTIEEQEEKQTVYEYDEVSFALPDGRVETVESITENFEDWWLYGCEDHTPPTLEERVSVLEDIIMEE